MMCTCYFLFFDLMIFSDYLPSFTLAEKYRLSNLFFFFFFFPAVWGGDPVYPTINYIQDPNEVIDYRGPDFHEPTPNMLSYLMEVKSVSLQSYYNIKASQYSSSSSLHP